MPRPERFGLFGANVHPEFLQPRRQPDVAVAPRRLHLQNPLAEIVQPAVAREIAKKMGGIPVQLGGKLNAAHQAYAHSGGMLPGLVVTRERVVVGDPKNANAGAHGLFNQLLRRAGSIGFVCVGV